MQVRALKFASLLMAGAMLSCTDGSRTAVVVQVSALSISKLPFVIAEDQGLYAKYGLDVELWTGPPPFDGGRQGKRDLWRRVGNRLGLVDHPPVEIWVQGATPSIVRFATDPTALDRISIASTDCIVRSHVIGRPGMTRLEDLKGKRLGVSSLTSTAGFIGRLVAERMGWVPDEDIFIVADSHEVEDLQNGLVDATVAYEMGYAVLQGEGYPILADTKEWNEHIGGNSVLVERQWLSNPTNRETAKRFLMALAEAISLLHRDPELAIRVLDDWYGIDDRSFAEKVISRGAWIPREPYPCYEGIERTMELYDSSEMRKPSAADFYEDSIVRSLADAGFIEALYE